MKRTPSTKTAAVRSSFASAAGGFVSTGRATGTPKGRPAASNGR